MKRKGARESPYMGSPPWPLFLRMYRLYVLSLLFGVERHMPHHHASVDPVKRLFEVYKASGCSQVDLLQQMDN